MRRGPPRREMRVVPLPGVPDLPESGPTLEWKNKWRSSIYDSIMQQELVERAALVEEIPPSTTEAQLKPPPGRMLLETPLAPLPDGGGDDEDVQRARASLRRLAELNAMRNEDALAAALRTQERKIAAKRALFAVGATESEQRSMAVGDPRWRRRIQHLIAFAERHSLTLRRCFEVAERLREREEAALAAVAREKQRKAMLWGGEENDPASRWRAEDPASVLRAKREIIAAEQAFDFRGFAAILGVVPPGAQDKQLFDLFDTRGLGLVDLQSFILVLLHCTSAAPQEKYRLVFHIIDRDQNGTLDLEELQLILKCNWQASDWEIEKKARAILRASDADGSGELDFNEFCTYCDDNPNVFLPEYLRNAQKARERKTRKAQSEALLEGVQDPALLASASGGNKKHRKKEKKKKGRAGRGGRGRGGRTRQQRYNWPLPALGVRKIIDLAHHEAADSLHVPLPPFRRMVEDNTIMNYHIRFGFHPSGFPTVAMAMATDADKRDRSRPGTRSSVRSKH